MNIEDESIVQQPVERYKILLMKGEQTERKISLKKMEKDCEYLKDCSFSPKTTPKPNNTTSKIISDISVVILSEITSRLIVFSSKALIQNSKKRNDTKKN